MKKQPVIELLTVPFLKADLSSKLPFADQELSVRGWPSFGVKTMRLILVLSLWTNAIFWEEHRLGWYDVVFGYAITALMLSPVFLILGLIFGWVAIKIGLVLLGLSIVYLLGVSAYILLDGGKA